MLNERDIIITDIVRVLHPIGHGAGYVSNFTQPDGLPTHEIIFRLSGESTSVFDDAIFCTHAGNIKYLPMGQGSRIHETRFDSGECINIFFHADAPLCDKATVFECVNFDEFKRLFEKAENIWLKKDVGYKYETISVLYRIIALLKKESDRNVSCDADYKRILPAVEYLNLKFRDANIDYDNVSKLCNMSYSYFRRLFTKYLGTSPAKYVVEKKIEYAKEMLTAKQYSIGEVAEAVGFKDIYYFSHVFKKITGVAPSRFVSD